MISKSLQQSLSELETKQEALEDAIETEKAKLILQSPEAGTTLKDKNSPVEAVFSDGPDPTVEVVLTDFGGMSEDEIRQWTEENKLLDVTYEYQYSSEVEKGKLIAVNVEGETIVRNAMVIFTISLGEEDSGEEIKEDIVVPDFSTYSRNQVSNWGSANQVRITFASQTSTTIEKGEFIKQSIAAGQKVREGSNITVTYSIGKPVEAVNLSGKSKTEALEWLASYDNRIKMTFYNRYSNTFDKNTVISNSPNSGTVNDGATMSVYISLGKPEVDDYTGKKYEDLKAAVDALNEDKASIVLNATEEESDTYSAGVVISQSVSGELSVGSEITVVYSSGKYVTVGNYTTESELKAFCDANGLLTKKNTDNYSSSVTKGNLISYDHKGEKVIEGTTIGYTVSLGSYSVADYTGKKLSDLEADLNAAKALGAPEYKINSSEEYDNKTNVAKGLIFEQSINGTTITVKISKGQSVTVPNFVGKIKGGSAEQLSAFEKLTVKYVSAGPSDEYAAGEIISQSLGADTVVEVGTEITLTYSEGKASSAVLPDFAAQYKNGDTEAATIKTTIENWLKNKGFTKYKVEIVDGGYSKNTVWYQTAPGTYPLDTFIEVKIQG